jgi:REP element-mobilizing transposase RayT
MYSRPWAGAAQGFEGTLAETCERHAWRIHACVIMRNHYHLALETPGANLVQGMHWLQGTFASRFNRFRAVHGYLFQGRYQSLLVEDASALQRVVHYIDLNPVRAGIVQPVAVATFRWGSLRRFVQRSQPAWLTGKITLTGLNLPDTRTSWAGYVEFLVALAGDAKRQQEMGFDGMCRGWAIGTAGWKWALAKEKSAMALEAGYEREELREIREARWRAELQCVLHDHGHAAPETDLHAQSPGWKLQIAARLRARVDAPYRWIAEVLKIPRPASLRTQIRRLALHVPG